MPSCTMEMMKTAVLLVAIAVPIGACHVAKGAGRNTKCAAERKSCTETERTSLRRYYFDKDKKRCYSFKLCPHEGDNFYQKMYDCVKDCRQKQKPTKCYDRKLEECRGDSTGVTAWTYTIIGEYCQKISNTCPADSKNKFATMEECADECSGFGRKGLIKKRRANKKQTSWKKV